MGKWNFDALFDGSTEQQRENVANFLKGVTHRTLEVSGRYADAVLCGDNAVHLGDRIAEYTEAVKQLTEDPRLRSLSAAVNEEANKKLEAEITKWVHGIIRGR